MQVDDVDRLVTSARLEKKTDLWLHAVQTVVQTCNVTTVVGTGAALDKNDLVRARASWQWSRKFDAGRREREERLVN